MGTLMRKPATATQPQELVLPGKASRSARAQPAQSVGSGVAVNEAAVDQTEAAAGATGNPLEDQLRQRAQRAEARCAELDETLATIREDLEKERQTAREAGYEVGVAEGREQALADQAERSGRLDALLDELHQYYSNDLKANEDELVEAVVIATGKILGKRMATRRGAAAAVGQACRALDKRRALVIRVAPDDLALMSADDALIADLGPNARFEADASVALGGCVVETDGGTLDARLDTQLESLRRVLLRARDKRADEKEATQIVKRPRGGAGK